MSSFPSLTPSVSLKEVVPKRCRAKLHVEQMVSNTRNAVLVVQLTFHGGFLHEGSSSNYLSYGKTAEKYQVDLDVS